MSWIFSLAFCLAVVLYARWQVRRAVARATTCSGCGQVKYQLCDNCHYSLLAHRLRWNGDPPRSVMLSENLVPHPPWDCGPDCTEYQRVERPR